MISALAIVPLICIFSEMIAIFATSEYVYERLTGKTIIEKIMNTAARIITGYITFHLIWMIRQ